MSGPAEAAGVPRRGQEPPGSASEVPLLEVDELQVHFRLGRLLGPRPVIRAVDGVSFRVRRGETLGLVGESGCGKTTLARAVVRLVEPTAGRVRFEGVDIGGLKGAAMRRQRRRMQIVFQDPFASLNPRQSVARTIGEPLKAHGLAAGRELDRQIDELLDLVGLGSGIRNRYPHEFSGGQRQRIGLARALALRPELVVADEPVSALDVSIQAQIVNLLVGLQAELGLTYLFIAHDLAVVRHVSDQVAVMYLGQLVEVAPADQLYAHPFHPYTISLLHAVPVPDPEIESTRERILLPGDAPSPAAPPPGCRFHTRCPFVQPTRCRDEVPQLRELAPGHTVACHWAEAIRAGSLRPARVAAGAPGLA
jgi:peptide/nickel transport system ATP-binding protein